jgi:hypothetical protein
MFGLFPSAVGAGLPMITRVILGVEPAVVGAGAAATAVGAGAADKGADVVPVVPSGAAGAAGCWGAEVVPVVPLLSSPEQAAAKTSTIAMAAMSNHARFELNILVTINLLFTISSMFCIAHIAPMR